MDTSLKNIETLKINAFEIAKANDVDQAFRDILDHLGVFTSHVISGHRPRIEYMKERHYLTGNESLPTAFERVPQDFVIGGGLEAVDTSNNFCLRLLPIIAYNKDCGLLISNGKDEAGKDISIDLNSIGEIKQEEEYEFDEIKREQVLVKEATCMTGRDYGFHFLYKIHDGGIGQIEDKIFRIVSVYLGDKKEQRHLTMESFKKKDTKWQLYDMEWRASITADGDSGYKEVAKKQMPIVKLYGLHGNFADNILDAKAPETPVDDPLWKRRIKIAEVLTSYSRDENGNIHLNEIHKEDVHFVSASQYWENVKENTEEGYTEVRNENFKKCKETAWKYGEPKCPFEAKDLKFIFKNAHKEVREEELAKIEKNKKDWDKWEEEMAFHAQLYNYRWTSDQTRTYSLVSVAEFNEAFHKSHRNDGTLKRNVVNRENIFLTEDTSDFEKIMEHQLRGEHIHIKRKSKDGKEWTIKLQSDDDSKNRILIKEYDYIDKGFEKVGLALREVNHYADMNSNAINKLDRKIDDEIDRRYNEDKFIIDKLNGHIKAIEAHGATSEAEKNRIAMRDDYGCFKVNVPKAVKQPSINPNLPSVLMPPPLDYVINIRYLEDRLLAFKQELALEMLTAKLVSCQREFEDWVNYNGSGTGYKVVYLQGRFNWTGADINLAIIGTEKVIGILDRNDKYPSILIRQDKRNNGVGVSGKQKLTSISNLTLNVEGYSSNELIGIRDCICIECNVTVTGEDGYKYKEKFDIKTDEYHTEGTSAVGFVDCDCTKCKATVKGGDGYSGLREFNKTSTRGGNAIGFSNSSLTDCECKVTGGNGGNGRNGEGYTNYQAGNGERGGDGGNGGLAKTFDGCTLTGNNKERAIGGNGGDAGHGGSGAGAGHKAGEGGNGGNGGDVYVLNSINGVQGNYGRGGNGGDGYNGVKGGNAGSHGNYGNVFITS